MTGNTPVHVIYKAVADWIRTASIGQINDSEKVERVMESLFSITWAMGDKVRSLYWEYLFKEASLTDEQRQTIHHMLAADELPSLEFFSVVHNVSYSKFQMDAKRKVNQALDGKGRLFSSSVTKNLASVRRELERNATGTMKDLLDRRLSSLPEMIEGDRGIRVQGGFYGNQYLYVPQFREFDLGYSLIDSGQQTNRAEDFSGWVFGESTVRTTGFNGILEAIYQGESIDGPSLYSFRSSINGAIGIYCPKPGTFGMEILFRRANDDVARPTNQRLTNMDFLAAFAKDLVSRSGELT
ncbi:MAG: hypothetical protein ACOCXT_00060 [Candidatus Dojkabacteria bacterium]